MNYGHLLNIGDAISRQFCCADNAHTRLAQTDEAAMMVKVRLTADIPPFFAISNSFTLTLAPEAIMDLGHV